MQGPGMKAKAFTIIELLVAIGIIAVLAGIILLAVGALSGGAGAGATQVDLRNLQGMLGEFDAVAGMNERNKPSEWFNAAGTIPGTIVGDFWISWDGALTPITAPGDVRDGQADRETHQMVLNTVMAMARLQAVPSVRSMVEALPSDRQMRLPENHPDSAIDETQYPIVLDAWNNPIIFVPGNGLEVKVTANAGDTNGDGKVDYDDVPAANRIVISPEGQTSGMAVTRAGRPFWASAGPDGDFMKGDDNLYSFEQ